MADADTRLIGWLLHESGISRYHIAKETDISESTLSRIVSGDIPMDAIRFGYACILTSYARRMQREQKR